ncbi:MAG: hypothetical protein K2X27_04335 [Candidatus Obscuribacterales bacterium]|nr:hypothetical protein [Candidatus Obscuribacterales bacterium]
MRLLSRSQYWLLAIALGMLLGLQQAALSRELSIMGGRPSEGLAKVLARTGWQLGPNTQKAEALLVLSAALSEQEKRSILGEAEKILQEGKLLILSIGKNPENCKVLEELLPVNLWSASLQDLVRGPCGLLPSREGLRYGLNGIRLCSRYDLHLPYSPMEAGEQRYQFKKMHKSLQNTDWRILAKTDSEGQLPAIVEGRYKNGKVIVVGFDLNEESLLREAGTENLLSSLLSIPTGGRSPGPSTYQVPLKISIDRHQEKQLRLKIKNEGEKTEKAVLSYKVSSFDNSLLNSESVDFELPAHSQKEIQLIEKDNFQSPVNIKLVSEENNYRVIDAAILSADRNHLYAETRAIVDKNPALLLNIIGEDLRDDPQLKSFPDRETGNGLEISGSAPVYQRIYFDDSKAALKVRLSNRLHNIAPLAKVLDKNWPANPSSTGLNDGCYAHGSRGYLLKPEAYGAWSGRSARTQELELEWDSPVIFAGQEIHAQTPFRTWDRSNPKCYELFTKTSANTVNKILSVEKAEYINGRKQDLFPPVRSKTCSIKISNLDEKADLEPRPSNNQRFNCSITEWQVLGWPDEQADTSISGKLRAFLKDSSSVERKEIFSELIELPAHSQCERSLSLPAKSGFRTAVLEIEFQGNNGSTNTCSFPLLFIPRGKAKIQKNPPTALGLFCEPGFSEFLNFGIGTKEDTKGWVGADNGIWAATHGFMEEGRTRLDLPERMFSTATPFSHYSTPWRDFHNGQYFWQWAGTRLLNDCQAGRFKTGSKIHLFLSDRWNGLDAGQAFAWSEFIRFDKYLRTNKGQGLKGRSRGQICAEICNKYGDVWQKWQMNTYADQLLAIKEKLASKGFDFSVSTHGSFPLAGGELGKKFASTHKACGIDLFWELQKEDLYSSLGKRLGLLAANSDYVSGAYNEWGYNSAVLSNSHWFNASGSVESSRRQWLSTYLSGRVAADSEFHPLVEYGFYSQTGFGAKNNLSDWQNYYDTMRLCSLLRPSQAAGFGLLAAWETQERNLGPKLGAAGIGLYARQGKMQLDDMAGRIYASLVKNGLPLDFVASVANLSNWKRTNPLVLTEAFTLNNSDLQILRKLNKAGTPIIAFFEDLEKPGEAPEFFGTKIVNGVVIPLQNSREFTLKKGIRAFVPKIEKNEGARILIQISFRDFGPDKAKEILPLLNEFLPRRTCCEETGLVLNEICAFEHEFISVANQTDENRLIHLKIPLKDQNSSRDAVFKLINVLSGEQMKATQSKEELRAEVPLAACDACLLVIEKAEKSK